MKFKSSNIKPEDLLSAFRISYNPRIVVTMDVIATVTDIRPLQIVMFMRAVKSPGTWFPHVPHLPAACP